MDNRIVDKVNQILETQEVKQYLVENDKLTDNIEELNLIHKIILLIEYQDDYITKFYRQFRTSPTTEEFRKKNEFYINLLHLCSIELLIWMSKKYSHFYLYIMEILAQKSYHNKYMLTKVAFPNDFHHHTYNCYLCTYISVTLKIGADLDTKILDLIRDLDPCVECELGHWFIYDQILKDFSTIDQLNTYYVYMKNKVWKERTEDMMIKYIPRSRRKIIENYLRNGSDNV